MYQSNILNYDFTYKIVSQLFTEPKYVKKQDHSAFQLDLDQILQNDVDFYIKEKHFGHLWFFIKDKIGFYFFSNFSHTEIIIF